MLKAILNFFDLYTYADLLDRHDPMAQAYIDRDNARANEAHANRAARKARNEVFELKSQLRSAHAVLDKISKALACEPVNALSYDAEVPPFGRKNFASSESEHD